MALSYFIKCDLQLCMLVSLRGVVAAKRFQASMSTPSTHSTNRLFLNAMVTVIIASPSRREKKPDLIFLRKLDSVNHIEVVELTESMKIFF